MKFSSVSSLDVEDAVAQSVFNAARAMFPPGTVIHLGAGSGQGTLHQWRQWDDVPASLVVDTQANRLSWAQAWVNAGGGRLVSDATVSAADGQAATLLHTSNPDETGLVALLSLHALWPQLRQTDLVSCQTRGLDSLIAELVGSALSDEKCLWLLVDFFCAADFWAGASEALARARVVILRQTVKEIEGIEPADAVARRMSGLGYVRCASLESNHPEVVHFVYQRGLIKDLQAAQTISLELTWERDAQVRATEQALAQRAQEAKAKEDALVQLEALGKEKEELLGALDAQVRATEQALAQRAQEAKAKEDALSQCSRISAEKDAETQRKNELLAQRDILVQEKSGLAAAREFEMQAKSEAQGERDAKARVIAAQRGEMERLLSEIAVLRADLDGAQLRAQATETQNQNLYLRQDLLQDEMTKAEAQIDLIKDLLLREPKL